MYLKISKKLTKLLVISLTVTASSYSVALTLIPSIGTCYGVGSDDKMSFKSYCKMEGGGGTGIYSDIYTIKGKKYYITYTDDDNVSMNDHPVQIYGRNKEFNRVAMGKNYTYTCYKSSKGHFCTK